MSFTGLEGEFLVGHGMSVELGERISGTAKRCVHGTIHLVKARLSLLRHRWNGRGRRLVLRVLYGRRSNGVSEERCFRGKGTEEGKRNGHMVF